MKGKDAERRNASAADADADDNGDSGKDPAPVDPHPECAGRGSAEHDDNAPAADEGPMEQLLNKPGAGLSAADTATGDVTAAGGPRFDRDLSEHPPARREEAMG